MTRPLLERQERLVGHTSIAAQLDWCREHGVERAVFAHCGSEIVKSDRRAAVRRVAALGRARGVAATIVRDGLEIQVR